MVYSDIIDINKNIQNSVNIDYDLHNLEKINEYIPTSDVCDVLMHYTNALLGRNNDYSTTLIGPYGKGKSFLILVLLEILSSKNYASLENVLKKIRIVDQELYELILEVKRKSIRLLPVIIDSNYFDINQSFLLALNDALDSNGLDNIVPNTIYDVCLNLLEKWQASSDTSTKMNVCIKDQETTLKWLKKHLNQYDYKAYEKFVSIYNCISNGLDFNPLVNTDIVKLYKDIINQLHDYGFQGIFIVYDEFSKTLESNKNQLSINLKLIQDFAEAANRSNIENQLHLCCITHKSINLYSERNSELFESFKTVEGRFKEIRFNRSLSENYELIALSLKKKEKFERYFEKKYEENSGFYNALIEENCFLKEDKKRLFKGCYPFNPIAVLALIRLSEIVAQNERTLFTLISDNDENSFYSFICNNGSGLYNVDLLYDYFESLLRKESGAIKNVWYKTEVSLKKVTKKEHVSIIKALSVIYLINDYSELDPTIRTISRSLNLDVGKTELLVEELIQNKILKRSFATAYISFEFNSSQEIEYEIEKYLSKNKSIISSTETLNAIQNNKYLIPRRYNMEHKITRFFEKMFIDSTDFLRMSSFEIFFRDYYADGFVLQVLTTVGLEEKILNHFSQMENKEAVVLQICTDFPSTLLSEVQYYNALENVKNNSNLQEEIKQQMMLMAEEKLEDLRIVLDKGLRNARSYYWNKNILSINKNLTEICSNICERIYSKTPSVNNEMINKSTVTKSYQKPRNRIVDSILSHNLEDYISTISLTGPDMTVYNSFFDDRGNVDKKTKEIIQIIKEYIIENYNDSNMLDDIVRLLKSKPYGIRNGVLPVYFAIAFSNMEDSMILYYKTTQIELSSESINKFIDNPKDYRIHIASNTKEKEEYLKNILRIFDAKSTNSFTNDLELSKALLRKWYLGLPMIIKEITLKDNYLGLPEETIKIKNIFERYDLNSYDTMFENIPNIFDRNLNASLTGIKKSIHLENYVDSYITKISTEIKNAFIEGYLGSIKSCIKEWCLKENILLSEYILDGINQKIKNVVPSLSFDDKEASNQLASVITGYMINDWASDNKKEVFKHLCDFVKQLKDKKANTKVTVKNNTPDDGNYSFSPLGEMLKNSLAASLEEFNESIDNEEKVNVMLSLIRELKNGG